MSVLRIGPVRSRRRNCEDYRSCAVLMGTRCARRQFLSRRGPTMRLLAAFAILSVLAAPAAAGDDQIERVVARNVRQIVPDDGSGGAAVALRLGGRTLFFNYGFAERVSKRPITGDSLFNLASLRKVFDATLLAQVAGNGELGLDDKVAD